MPSSNAATSRSPSSQSDWFSQGGQTFGPLPSTLSVGDYNKLLIDTKRLMSTNQLPYVAKLTTDSSGEDSDRTNITKNTIDSLKEASIKTVTSACSSPTDKMSEQQGVVVTTNSQETQKAMKASSEHRVNSQLPPLSPPSVKRQGTPGTKYDLTSANDATPSKTLIVNGTKCSPVNGSPNVPERPGFLTNFPRPSSTCGNTSPVPYSKPSSKLSPISSSPKPFLPNLFKPIANSSPITSVGTPTRQIVTTPPKTIENNDESTALALKNCSALSDNNSTTLVRLSDCNKNMANKDNKDSQTTSNKTDVTHQNGLNSLLTEVDKRIRFSLDIDSAKPQPAIRENEALNIQSFQSGETFLKNTSSVQSAQNMKEDLSQVKKDIGMLRNDLTVAKQGLENGKQPLLVSCCILYPTW